MTELKKLGKIKTSLKGLKINIQQTRELQNESKRNNINIFEVLDGKEDNQKEKAVKDIIAETSPELENACSQIQ